VLLELGGNNAAVVHGDADVAQAVESTLFGATGTAVGLAALHHPTPGCQTVHSLEHDCRHSRHSFVKK
jgi:hypothetical protein